MKPAICVSKRNIYLNLEVSSDISFPLARATDIPLELSKRKVQCPGHTLSQGQREP
jgi:hypothetical protein